MKQNMQVVIRRSELKYQKLDNLEDCSKIKNTDLCEKCYEMLSHVFFELCKNISIKS